MDIFEIWAPEVEYELNNFKYWILNQITFFFLKCMVRYIVGLLVKFQVYLLNNDCTWSILFMICWHSYNFGYFITGVKMTNIDKKSCRLPCRWSMRLTLCAMTVQAWLSVYFVCNTVYMCDVCYFMCVHATVYACDVCMCL